MWHSKGTLDSRASPTLPLPRSRISLLVYSALAFINVFDFQWLLQLGIAGTMVSAWQNK